MGKVLQVIGVVVFIASTAAACWLMLHRGAHDDINTALLCWLAGAVMFLAGWVQDVKSLIDEWVCIMKQISGVQS